MESLAGAAMFAIALVFGIGMAALCSIAIGCSRGKWAIGGLVGVLAFTIFCAPVVASPFLFLQALVLLVVVGFGLRFSPSRNYLIGACWAASAGAFALAIFVGQTQVWHLRELQEKYPFVSLGQRLSYEVQPSNGSPSPHNDVVADKSSVEPITLAALAEKQLREEEADSAFGYRHYMLERLHDAEYEAFIASTGFGVGRMMRVHDEGLKLREERAPREELATRLPVIDGLQSAQQLPEQEADPHSPGAIFPPRFRLESMADGFRQDFLNSERFGFVRDKKASGFVSHRIVYLPSISEPDDAQEPWKLARLELVSLLKFPQPAVYLSDELPNMEQLSNVPTRPLNNFERDALARLRTDEDLVTRYSANTIRMLGSLRAGKTCLECHSVQRGELLGAFSYELRRTSPIPAPAPLPAKPKPEV